LALSPAEAEEIFEEISEEPFEEPSEDETVLDENGDHDDDEAITVDNEDDASEPDIVSEEELLDTEDTQPADDASVVTAIGALSLDLLDDDTDGSADTSWYNEEGNAFALSTAAELRGLAQLVCGGTDFADVTICLDADIDLSETTSEVTATDLEVVTEPQESEAAAESALEWTPIGTSENPFKGTFDGNGKTVSGLSVASSDAYQGLFGYIDGAVIKNLTVNGSVSGGSSTGGVAGYARGSAFEHITVNVTVTGSATYTGGIVGYAVGTTAFTDCVNNGAVEGGAAQTGGIVGYAYSTASAPAIFTGCVNNGAVKGGTTHTGGIAGYIYGGSTSTDTGAAMTDVSNTGAIVGGTTHTAGIVGYSGAGIMITDASNSGAVTGGTSNIGYTAGIVGQALTGTTIDAASNSGAVTGLSYVAGIVAAVGNNSTIAYSDNSGAISGSGTSSTAGYYIAGIVASVTSTTTNPSEITDCKNTGDVTSTNTTTTGSSYTGGIVGSLGAAASINRSWNEGAVTVSARYPGGVVSHTAGTNTVSNSYNMGIVTGVNGYAGGGIVGNGNASTNVFYNNYTAGERGVNISGTPATGQYYYNYYLSDATDWTSYTIAAMSEADMKSDALLARIGYAFTASSGGYPVLYQAAGQTGVTFNYNESSMAALGADMYSQRDNTVVAAKNNDGTVTDPTAFIKSGYRLLSWHTDAKGTSDPIDFEEAVSGTTLYANWGLAGLTVTFDYGYAETDGEGNKTESEVVSYQAAVAEKTGVIRQGYEFMGWYLVTETDAQGAATKWAPLRFDFNTLIIQDTILLARWSVDGAAYDWYTEDLTLKNLQ